MRSRIVAAVALLFCCLGTAGCAQRHEPPVAPAGATGELRVGLTEWSIETGRVEVVPGEVRLLVTNAGATVHDLVVHGDRGTWRTPLLSPGQQHVLDIATEPGEQLHLDCSVTGHHAQGMHGSLPVGNSGATGTAGGS